MSSLLDVYIEVVLVVTAQRVTRGEMRPTRRESSQETHSSPISDVEERAVGSHGGERPPRGRPPSERPGKETDTSAYECTAQ